MVGFAVKFGIVIASLAVFSFGASLGAAPAVRSLTRAMRSRHPAAWSSSASPLRRHACRVPRSGLAARPSAASRGLIRAGAHIPPSSPPAPGCPSEYFPLAPCGVSPSPLRGRAGWRVTVRRFSLPPCGEGRVGGSRAAFQPWEPKPARACMGIGGVSMSRRLIALLILTVTVLTACGRVQSTRPASAGYLLFLEEGFSNGAQQVTVRDSATGNITSRLPIGTAAPDWSRYYTVTQLSGSARLAAIDPASGRTLAQTTIPAGYTLPDFGYAGTSAGLSPNGQWLALTSQGKRAGSGVVTDFLVGSSFLSDPFVSIQVEGNFSFDALSNDGQ